MGTGQDMNMVTVLQIHVKKLEYDLYYIKNRSVTLDIRIIFKTINTIVFYKGR